MLFNHRMSPYPGWQATGAYELSKPVARCV
jgi:hypothetical protein